MFYVRGGMRKKRKLAPLPEKEQEKGTEEEEEEECEKAKKESEEKEEKIEKEKKTKKQEQEKGKKVDKKVVEEKEKKQKKEEKKLTKKPAAVDTGALAKVRERKNLYSKVYHHHEKQAVAAGHSAGKAKLLGRAAAQAAVAAEPGVGELKGCSR